MNTAQSNRPRTDLSISSSHSRDDRDARLAIDATDVHVTYEDGTEAVRGVDLAVGDGERFGFLGPKGAGKSTTIKTFVTLLHPTHGTVAIEGYDATEQPRAVRESIGHLVQETSVNGELTARENLRFACDPYGDPRAERDDQTARAVRTSKIIAGIPATIPLTNGLNSASSTIIGAPVPTNSHLIKIYIVIFVCTTCG